MQLPEEYEEERNVEKQREDHDIESCGLVENFGMNKYPLSKQKKTDVNKERLKALQKVWIAVTKFIASQCEKGRVVDVPFAGKFKKVRDSSAPSAAYEDMKDQYAFLPQLDFVASGHFKLGENLFNVSPFSKAASGFQSNVVTVSLTSIAAVCGHDREAVAQSVKSVFTKFVSNPSTEHQI